MLMIRGIHEQGPLPAGPLCVVRQIGGKMIVNEQPIVITGASTDVGKATALYGKRHS